MNRKQRRIAAKIPAHERPDFYEVGIPYDMELKDGDRFTVKGHKRLRNGVLIKNCKPGEETVFTARVRPE
jgi:hypothetical protein